MATHAEHEVLLTTDCVAQPWSISAWDTEKGSSVGNFRGQAVAPQCLCLRSNHTLIGASEGKPVLQLWPLSRKEESQQKIICPGKVSAMAFSPDGLFCIVAIAEKIYVWEMTAGGLLNVISDFDEVTVIRFTDCGSQFVTGSSGGSLLMWDFASVVSKSAHRVKGTKARHRIHAHSADITDIHVGCGGLATRVATSSADFSCKLWDLITGELMKTIIYEEEVHSVIMDQAETYMFVGLESGEIRCTPLYGQIAQPEGYAKNMTKAGEKVFRGHTGCVSCLALSSNGLTLASGSADGSARLWNMEEENSSVQIDHAGPVTNVLLVPRTLLDKAPVYGGPSVSFQHQRAGEGERGRVVNVTISDASEWPRCDDRTEVDMMLGLTNTPDHRNKDEVKMDTSDEIMALREEVAQLKQVNKDLYNFMAKKIVTDDGGKAAGD